MAKEIKDLVVQEEEPKTRKSMFGKYVGVNKIITCEDDEEETRSVKIIEGKKSVARKKRKDSVDKGEEELSTILTSKEPIINSYKETSDALKTTVLQTDQILNEVKVEFDAIRASRTSKGKYTIITDLSSVMSNLISTKIAAIREINNNITTANKLELSRAKELKIDVGDDNSAIMGLYETMINQPKFDPSSNSGAIIPQPSMGYINSNSAPSMPSLMANFSNAYNIEPQYTPQDQFSPEQNRMIIENNPNVKVVVVYDRSNEDRYFKMMDITTGQYYDNVSLPDPFLLEGMTFNFQTKTARNPNTNMNFPLIELGKERQYSEPSSLSDQFSGF